MEGEVESEVDGYTGQKKTSLHKNVDFLSGDRGQRAHTHTHTQPETHRCKSMGGYTNIKYMDECTHAHARTHFGTTTLKKSLVSYISRPADESS